MSEILRGLTVAVTGVNGFVGRVTASRLMRAGARVCALAGPPPPDRAEELPAGISLLRGEITDRDLIQALVAGADIVVHVAGPSSVAASFECPADYIRTHTLGTAVVLDACRHAGIRRLVYVSSAEVYGQPPRTPVREDHPLRARSPYGAAKIGAEALLRAVDGAWDLDTIVLRPFSIYGPRLAPHSLLGTIVRQLLTRDELSLGDLRPIRDYCYVDDVAEAIVRACAAGRGHLVLNIGTGRGTSVAELAAAAMNAAGRRVPLVQSGVSGRPRAADIFYLVADPRQASEALGWTAATSLEDGLKATIQWMHELSASS